MSTPAIARVAPSDVRASSAPTRLSSPPENASRLRPTLLEQAVRPTSGRRQPSVCGVFDPGIRNVCADRLDGFLDPLCCTRRNHVHSPRVSRPILCRLSSAAMSRHGISLCGSGDGTAVGATHSDAMTGCLCEQHAAAGGSQAACRGHYTPFQKHANFAAHSSI